MVVTTWDDHRRNSGGQPRKLTFDQATELRRMYAAGGWTMKQLSLHFDLNVRAVFLIIHHRTYTTPVKRARTPFCKQQRWRHRTDHPRTVATRDDYCACCGTQQVNALCHIEGIPDRRAEFVPVN